MADTSEHTDDADLIDRARVRTVDSLIPVVQRAAGPTAVLRDSRLVIGVLADGTLATRIVPASR